MATKGLKRIRFDQNAIMPLMIGLFLVIASNAAVGWMGAIGSRPLGAQPAGDADVSVPGMVCVESTERDHDLPAGTNQASSFGFLEFELDPVEGSSIPGFGPLPATVCTHLER
jgi:hypothetical protein